MALLDKLLMPFVFLYQTKKGQILKGSTSKSSDILKTGEFLQLERKFADIANENESDDEEIKEATEADINNVLIFLDYLRYLTLLGSIGNAFGLSKKNCSTCRTTLSK